MERMWIQGPSSNPDDRRTYFDLEAGRYVLAVHPFHAPSRKSATEPGQSMPCTGLRLARSPYETRQFRGRWQYRLKDAGSHSGGIALTAGGPFSVAEPGEFVLTFPNERCQVEIWR